MAQTLMPLNGSRMTTLDIPKGFVPLARRSPLTEPWQPIFAKTTDEAVILGLRLATPHAALTDAAMGYSCAHRMDNKFSLVTVGLSVDFIGSAKIGEWLTIESNVVKTGSTICFVQCLAIADDAVIARANATFRVVPKA
jgi:hypothetical protein